MTAIESLCKQAVNDFKKLIADTTIHLPIIRQYLKNQEDKDLTSQYYKIQADFWAQYNQYNNNHKQLIEYISQLSTKNIEYSTYKEPKEYYVLEVTPENRLNVILPDMETVFLFWLLSKK